MKSIQNKKISVLVLTFLCLLVGRSQVSTDLPQIIPHSPEAAKIGRYGIVPLNSSTGQMNYSIPLYTIEAGNYDWPISLQYNYGGLLLESKPSLFGLGWHLVANGAVVREIRGLPDESDFGYYGDSSQRGLVQTAFTNGDITHLDYQQFDRFRDGVFDGEPDKYTVNVGNISFSFKIDENGLPVFLSKHNHKVEVNLKPNNGVVFEVDNVVVTSDNGTKYTFDVVEYSVVSDDDQTNAPDIPTSWLLSRIDFPNKHLVQFQYTPDNDYKSYDFSAKGVSLYFDFVDPLNYDWPQEVTPGYGSKTSESTVKRQILTGITFPGGQVDLPLKEITDPDENRTVYDAISIIPQSSVDPIWDYQFTYLGERDALTKITRNGTHFYEFQYYGVNDGEPNAPSMPDFIDDQLDTATAKDKWEYYNGVNNTYAVSIPNSNITANIDPSFLHTKLGAMTKITYPTRGYSNIAYETNDIKTANIIGSEFYENVPLSSVEKVVRLDAQLGEFGAPFEREEWGTIVVDEPTVAEIRHWSYVDFGSQDPGAGSMHFLIQIFKEEGCPYSSFYPPDFSFPLVRSDYPTYAQDLREAIEQYNYGNPNSNLNPNVPPLCPELSFEIGPDGPLAAQGGLHSIADSSRGRVLLLPGTYKIRIQSLRNTTTDGFAEVGFRMQANVTVPPYYNEKVGGIRVKRIDHFASDSKVSNSDHFNYYDEDGYSTAIQNLTPYNKIATTRTHYLDNGVVNELGVNIYLFDNYTALNPEIGTPVYYQSIERYNNVSKSQGYVKTEYGLTGVAGNNTYPQIPEGRFYDIGRVISQESFKNNPSNNEKSLVEKSEFQFQQRRGTFLVTTKIDDNSNHPPSLVITPKTDSEFDFVNYTYGEGASLGSPDLAAIKLTHHNIVYKELDSRSRLFEETKEQILESGSIKDTTRYVYSLLDFDYPTSIMTRNSLGETLITEYEYPSSASSEPFMTDLVNRNQVSSPFRTKNTLLQDGQTIGEILNETKTVYGNDTSFSPGDIILPKEVFVKKEDLNPTDDLRAVYEHYDDRGNVLQYRKPNGVPVSFLWGFDKIYPIAKIENATYAEVENVMGNLTYGPYLTVLQEDTLRQGLPEAMVTTYKYNPLVGVSEIKDPRGHKTRYTYDDLNRLQFITDDKDKMVKEYKYSFRTESYVDPEDSNSFPAVTGSITGPDNADYLGQETYTVGSSGGSGQHFYTWYLDDAFVVDGTNSATIEFDVIGTAQIRVDIYDSAIGKSVSVAKTVSVVNDLGAVSLTPSASQAVVGNSITFNSSGINPGSGSLSYQWFVDSNSQPESFTESTGFSASFASPGQHSVLLRVTDDVTGDVIEGTVTVQIYSDLSVPTLVTATSPVVEGTSVGFVTGNISGGNVREYKWYVNDVEQSYTQSGPFFHQFNQDGTHVVKFRVEDNTLGLFEEVTTTVVVYDDLSISALTVSNTEIFINNSVTAYAPTVSGGSANKSYEWRVNDGLRSTALSNLTVSLTDFGANTILFRVTDNDLGIVRETSQNVQVYNPINTPSLTASTTDIVPNTSITFTTANIWGGSGNRSFEWYVDDVLQAYTGQTNFTYSGLSTLGNHTVRFRVVDNELTGHAVEVSETITVYGEVDAGAITGPTSVTINNDASYSISPSSGSGNFSYNWTVNPPTGPNQTFTTQSFTVNMDWAFNGTTVVSCSVVDNLTGDSDYVSVNVDVGGAPNLITKQLKTDIDVNDYYGNYRLTASVSGGSGSYSYKWYNGTTLLPTTANNITLYLDCSNNTDSIRLVVTDQLTGIEKENTRVYTFSGSGCSGGGGNQ